LSKKRKKKATQILTFYKQVKIKINKINWVKTKEKKSHTNTYTLQTSKNKNKK
jgi:preprotein translocase subunit SecE